jgi:hypothetical protein
VSRLRFTAGAKAGYIGGALEIVNEGHRDIPALFGEDEQQDRKVAERSEAHAEPFAEDQGVGTALRALAHPTLAEAFCPQERAANNT